MQKKGNRLKLAARAFADVFRLIPCYSVLMIVCAVVNGFFPALVVAAITRLVDGIQGFVSGTTDKNVVIQAGIILFVCYLAKQVCQLLSAVAINAGLFEKYTYYNRLRIAEKSAKLSLIQSENPKMQNLRQRVQECVEDEVMNFFFYNGMKLFTGVLSVISIAAVLISYNVLFLVIAVVSVLPFLIQRIHQGKDYYELRKKLSWENRECTYLWETFFDLSTAKDMRLMQSDGFLKDKWREKNEHMCLLYMDYKKRRARGNMFSGLLVSFGYILSLAGAFVMAVKKLITVGQFSACLSAFTDLQSSMKECIELIGEVPKSMGFLSDYYEYLDLEKETGGKETIESFEGLSCEGVSFGYPGLDTLVLKDLSLQIQMGEKVAIVGENGSGKTTLIKLLLGQYPPSSGLVNWNGKDLSGISQTSVCGLASVLPQTFNKYKMSIRDNIAISDMEQAQNDEKIMKAVEQAGCQAVYEKCGGLDEMLGRDFSGTDLSGGEWQSLAMARSLFKPAELIVLDEPTSALDAIKETEILSRYIESIREKTAIIISHRIGMCRLMDKVIVMKNGRIAEIGTHDELLQKEGEYYRLYQAQRKWYQ